MTQEILNYIIGKVEEAGFHVVGVICDMESSNRGLATKLGITIDNTFFEHPCRPGQQIFWFFDSVHGLKNSR